MFISIWVSIHYNYMHLELNNILFFIVLLIKIVEENFLVKKTFRNN